MVKQFSSNDDSPRVLKKTIDKGKDCRGRNMVTASLNILNNRNRKLSNENQKNISPKKKCKSIESRSFYSNRLLSTPPKYIHYSPKLSVLHRSKVNYQPYTMKSKRSTALNNSAFDKLLGKEDKIGAKRLFDDDHDDDDDATSSKKIKKSSEREEIRILKTPSPSSSPEMLRRESSSSSTTMNMDSPPLRQYTSYRPLTPLANFRDSPELVTPFKISSQSSSAQSSQLRPSNIIPNRPLDWNMGFPNNGNTCYLSSVVQCIIRISKVTEIVSKTMDFQDKLDKQLPEKSIIRMLSAIIKGDGVLANNLKTIRDVCKFTKGEQHDAQEFLMTFLECMSDEITKYAYPDLSVMFKGFFKFETRKRFLCEKCKAVVLAETEEMYTSMMLAIPSDITDLSIKKLIPKYFEEEPVQDGTPCRKCGCKNWNQFRRIENLPDFLIVQLVRYKFDKVQSGGTKVKTPVCANKFLDLSEFLEPFVPIQNDALAIPSVINENVALRSPLKGIENSNQLRQRNENLPHCKTQVVFNSCIPKSPCKINTISKTISLKGGHGFPNPESKDVSPPPPILDSLNVTENGSQTDPNLQTNEILAIANEPHNIDLASLSDEEQFSLAVAASLNDVEKNKDSDLEEAIRRSISEAEAARDSKASIEEEEEIAVLPIIEEEEEERGAYELFGVINHIGGTSLEGGHYISYVHDQMGQVWHQFNDTNHAEKNMCQVKMESLTNGYLFFYSKT